MIITNNIKVRDFFNDQEIIFVDGNIRDVFVLARDYVHKGHTIMTHPLSGSVKPMETPFKSILLTKNTQSLNVESLNLIEQALIICDTFADNALVGVKWQNFSQKDRRQQLTQPEENMLEDFREIDFILFANALAVH